MQDFEGKEKFLPNKGGGQSGTTRNWWKNVCPSQQQSAQVNLFLIIFPVATKLVQVWEEKALEQEVRTELVVPETRNSQTYLLHPVAPLAPVP